MDQGDEIFRKEYYLEPEYTDKDVRDLLAALAARGFQSCGSRTHNILSQALDTRPGSEEALMYLHELVYAREQPTLTKSIKIFFIDAWKSYSL